MSSSVANRHLLTFSYLGSCFKASSKNSKDADLTTVVGSLECAFHLKSKKFGITRASPITISSRTDRGVHALQNTAHIDLTIPEEKWYNANKLQEAINLFYYKRNIPLRISSIQQVSNEFNARRWAVQRSYLYRIAVPKPSCDNFTDLPIPISEVDRCHFLWDSNFNLAAVEEVLSIFPGVHNFSSFCTNPKRALAERSPIRIINSFDIRHGKPLMPLLFEPSSNNFDYWDFILEGRSFLYCQVRRMVSAAIAVAQGKCTVANVRRALESSKPIPVTYRIVPSHGLYLAKVTYQEEHLLINRKTLVAPEHATLVNLLDQYKLSLKKLN